MKDPIGKPFSLKKNNVKKYTQVAHVYYDVVKDYSQNFPSVRKPCIIYIHIILEYFFFDLFISLFSRQKGPQVVQADLLNTMDQNIQGTKPFILKNNVYQLRILKKKF